GASAEILKLLARSPSGRQLGLAPGAFSFNTTGGRCEACQGQGAVTLEMHFLADVTVPCEVCDGKRFTEKALGARIYGKNVAELLACTVDEALALLGDEPRVVRALRPFAEV